MEQIALPQHDTLTGTISRITFHAEESGYSVLRVDSDALGRVTVVGTVATVREGEHIEAIGAWRTDPKYGAQFQAVQLRVVPPATAEGIEKYLASGMVKGIGATYAKKLVAAFGAQTFEIIENEPDKLYAIPGIGKKRVEKILAAWRDQAEIRQIMTFLHGHGVGPGRAVRIYKVYGSRSIEAIRENPYELIDNVPGFGFKLADELAQRLGHAPDSELRCRAGVVFTLQEAANQGHTLLPECQLRDQAVRLLTIDGSKVEDALLHAIASGTLVEEIWHGERHLALKWLRDAERGVARQVDRLQRFPVAWDVRGLDLLIHDAEHESGQKLSVSQHTAIKSLLGEKVGILTGGPGVGKTYTLNTLLRVMDRLEAKVLLCAPTGRAAKRMSEATGGREAKTIHRLLEFNPGQGGFQRNELVRLDADLVVIDESSMPDIGLVNALMVALSDRCALLFVGDIDQLPPVGPGAVLSGLIASGRIAVARLTEIYRQAAGSKIVTNAHRINQGEMPVLPVAGEESDFYYFAADDPQAIQDEVVSLVTKRIPAKFGYHPVTDIQVLTATHKGQTGTKNLNALLQAELNPHSGATIARGGNTFAVGDKVIQLRNNYDLEVFNGDIGRICAIDEDEDEVRIEYDGRLVTYDLADLDDVALAYATTVHKSQGSEYPCVVLVLSSQFYIMLQRQLLYTAATRAKRLLVIVGDKRALAISVKNQSSKQRITMLAERLQKEGR